MKKTILMEKSLFILLVTLCVGMQSSADEINMIDGIGYFCDAGTKEAYVMYLLPGYSEDGRWDIPESVFFENETYKVTRIYDIMGGDQPDKIWKELKILGIPPTINYIARSAFEVATDELAVLDEVHITDLAAWCRIDFRSSPLGCAHRLFLNEEEIIDLVIPENVTSISKRAFAFANIKSVTFPAELETIGDYVFDHCDNLTSVVIPETVKGIGSYAFTDCWGLKSATILGDLTAIGEGAFKYCYDLSSITIKGSIGEIQDSQFSNLSQIKDVYCYADVPPAANTSTFESSPIEEATLHVPRIAIDSYRESPCWKTFGKIVNLENNPDGIENVQEPTPSPSLGRGAIYDLQGRRLQKAPQKGLYIQDGKKKAYKQ